MQVLRKLVKWTLIVIGSLAVLFVGIGIIAVATDREDEPAAATAATEPTAPAAEEPKSQWVQALSSPGTEWAKPGEAGYREAEPASAPVLPEPEPELVSVEVPDGWSPVDFESDGMDTFTVRGGLQHWAYIYFPSEVSGEQMIATALQVAIDVYAEHGGVEILVAVMDGPDAEYQIDTVTFYPTGCPSNRQCIGDVWQTSSSLTIPASVFAVLAVPSEAEAVRAEQAREAAERSRAAALKAEAERGDELYERCFNGWNGSHKLLVELVKENIDAPRSFKHVRTTAYLGDFPRPVVMQFDAQNVFGAMIRTTVKANSALDCSVVITEVVGP